MIGRAALRLVDRLGSIGLLLYQVASCMWSGQFRMRVLVELIAIIGVQSQPVVIITGAFTGAVLEAQTLFQLQTVRMETMGGAVVAVGMFRELGPVITGLMLAGRVGSAMAAEIGTMKVTEQVDALKSMNVDPVDYLVKPRIQAMLISMPILMMEAVLVGIASAYIVSVTAFNVDQAYWMHFMSKFVTMGDIIVALVKALVFGLIISTISYFYAQFRSNQIIATALQVMRAGVAAVIFDVVWNLGANVIRTRRTLYILLLVGAFAAKVFFGVQAMVLILGCLGVGLLDLLIQSRSKSKTRADASVKEV